MVKEQERNGALILTLPDETLLVVLENLTIQWDRQSWCVVCKKFRDLEAVSRKYVVLMRAEILEPVLRRYHHVEHLDMSSCVKLEDECLAIVAKIASQRLLSIMLNCQVTWFGAARYGVMGVRNLEECTYFQEMDLSCKQVSDKEVIALSKLQHLQKLKLNGCEYVTDVELSALNNCKELESLELKSCSRIGDVDIQNVATGYLQLCTIDLSFTEVSDKGLAFLTLLRNLECLSLNRCYNVTDEGLKLLKSGCTTLQKLDVTLCSNFSSHELVALIERSAQLQQLDLSYSELTSNILFSSLQKLKMLEVITLDGCSLGEADLNLIGKGCRELKEFNLRKCPGLIDVGVVGFVTTHTHLQKLDISSCYHITDVALEAVATNCKSLLNLKMKICLSVTIEGLILIGKFCLSLEDLDLTDYKLNDDGLKSIARCTKLRFLRIGYCEDITNAGLVHIGVTCRNLLEFDCYGSVGVGDEGVGEWLQAFEEGGFVILQICHRCKLAVPCIFMRSCGVRVTGLQAGDMCRSLPHCCLVQTPARVGCQALQLGWRPWRISSMLWVSKFAEDRAFVYGSDRRGDDGDSKYAVSAKCGSWVI